MKPFPHHEAILTILIKKVGLSQNVAEEVTLRILNYFGYQDEIIDNALDHDDRRLFYFLQDMQILGTRWEETQLLSGRNWRIFYWSLNWEAMDRMLVDRNDRKTDENVYMQLPESVWSRDLEPIGYAQ